VIDLLGAKARGEWAVKIPLNEARGSGSSAKARECALRSQPLGNLDDRFTRPHQFGGLGFTLSGVSLVWLCVHLS
jgi:hypothetical protein